MKRTAGPRRTLQLLATLVARDFRGQYRRSVLGPAWAVLQPLLYMLVFILVRSVLNIPSEDVPYAIFAFSALTPWTFFANAVTRSGTSVYSNAGIIKKIAIPREVFPASSVALSLTDMAISALILIAMMFWYRVPAGWALLWLLPLTALLAALALGVAMIVATIGTFKHDVVFAAPLLLQFWLLASPIMYPLGNVPERWKGAYSFNPMVGIVEGFRAALLRGSAPDWELIAPAVLVTLLTLALAWPAFRYCSQYFADAL